MSDATPGAARDLTAAAKSVRWDEVLKPRGVVRRVGDGVATIAGLADVRYEELLAFDSGSYGMAFDLRAGEVGAILLAGGMHVREGDGVVGLKIQLSRFESLEKLSRVGFDIDVNTQRTLQRGTAIRALLRQARFSPRSISEQVILLIATSEDWLHEIPARQVAATAQQLIETAREQLPQIVHSLDRGEAPSGQWKSALQGLVKEWTSRRVEERSLDE